MMKWKEKVFGFITLFVKKGLTWFVILGMTYFMSNKYLKYEMFNTKEIIRNDVISYYNYLPAIFEYKDLTFKTKYLLDWNVRLPDGRLVNKTSVGLAYFYAPFFLVTWQFFKLNGYNIDVYSPMFNFSLGLCALFVSLLAMIVMRSNLKKFFSEEISALCLIIIFLGTNAYYYSVFEGPYPHIFSLFLISLLINLSISWYNKPRWIFSVLLGLVAGWLVLVRPVNIIFCLFPILYGLDGFKSRLIFWKTNLLKIGAGLIAAFLIWLPQLLYWKYATGNYLFFSYVGERFFWTEPEIFRGIFSYRNGWLVYTPLMVLSVAGFVVLFFKNRSLFFALLAIYLLNIYLVYSWWCWWYSGFGSRAMVDSYAISVIPVGFFLSWLFQKIKWWFIAVVIVISGFIYLNIFQSWQKYKGLIHWAGMTKELYWAHFLKENFVVGCDQMVKLPDVEKAHKQRVE